MCRNSPFSSKAGRAHSTPPKETSRQVSKRVEAPSRRPNGRQDAFVGPGASGAHFGRGIKGGPRGFVGGVGWLWNGSFFGCWLPWLAGTRPDQSSLLNRLAERVELEAQFLGDFPWAPTSREQLLCLGRDLRRDHRSSAWRARRVECCHAPGAISVDTANDAVFRDAEGPHDVRLAASPLADQLSGKHPEERAGHSRRCWNTGWTPQK